MIIIPMNFTSLVNVIIQGLEVQLLQHPVASVVEQTLGVIQSALATDPVVTVVFPIGHAVLIPLLQ